MHSESKLFVASPIRLAELFSIFFAFAIAGPDATTSPRDVDKRAPQPQRRLGWLCTKGGPGTPASLSPSRGAACLTTRAAAPCCRCGFGRNPCCCVCRSKGIHQPFQVARLRRTTSVRYLTDPGKLRSANGCDGAAAGRIHDWSEI